MNSDHAFVKEMYLPCLESLNAFGSFHIVDSFIRGGIPMIPCLTVLELESESESVSLCSHLSLGLSLDLARGFGLRLCLRVR